jgi:ubiquinone/menaquinone biosynthesis C-methylase UbiE
MEELVQKHLDLQVKISYDQHHDFLIRHGLKSCSHVLDVGTGNGTFAARLSQDHPEIQFVGIDKRRPCVEACHKIARQNFTAMQVDMFAREMSFDFSRFDGILMRYFLLHVDHSQKILELFKAQTKRPSKFWIIDLDWSQFSCEPQHASFDKMTKLVQEFCAKISVDSLGGQNVVPLLRQLHFQNITVENIPFSNQSIPLADFTLYLKQEVQCYSRMMGQSASLDPDTQEIIQFIDSEVSSGRYQVSYGMILISAELTD